MIQGYEKALLDDINARQNKIQKLFEDICFENDVIKKNIEYLCLHEYREERRTHKKNPYIVKAVIKYMAQGNSYYDSVKMAAVDFETTEERVKILCCSHKFYLTAINLYARRYTAERLKKAGLKTKEIAKILGISENHVYKLLKYKLTIFFNKS